jgi:hypothetical protein
MASTRLEQLRVRRETVRADLALIVAGSDERRSLAKERHEQLTAIVDALDSVLDRTRFLLLRVPGGPADAHR